MGLSLPAELTGPLGWIGLTWPEADEELLFDAGRRWVAYAAELHAVATDADRQAGRVWELAEGDAVDAFRAWWTGDEGPSPRLSEDAEAALLIGGALMAFAAITLALKVAFIVQLIALAVEVAQAIATAFVTFGATTAEIPAFVAATRLVCRRLVEQVVEHVTTVVEDVFRRAAALLRRSAVRPATRVAGDLAEHGTAAVRIPPVKTLDRYEGKPMLDRYRYETVPGHPRNPFNHVDGAVRRLDEQEREAYRIVVDDDGLLRRASDGSLFDTRDAVSLHSPEGRAIFVMDRRGNLYASNDQELGVFHHSTLGNGQPVAAAGELKVVDGRLEHATAASGHYQPGREQMAQLAEELRGHGLRDIPVYAFDGTTPLF